MNEFAAYLDGMKSGQDANVAAGITRAFANCVDGYYSVSDFNDLMKFI
jgi:hypothetical protein